MRRIQASVDVSDVVTEVGLFHGEGGGWGLQRQNASVINERHLLTGDHLPSAGARGAQLNDGGREREGGNTR